MNSPLISIIVPIFNSSKYLQKCLDSIIEQTYTNIEIILVDDGSSDNSLQICNTYATLDKRVRVIHQQNMGAVGARKTGIEYCLGNYIMFVDSDDTINLEMCIKLLKKALDANADMVICDYANIISDEKKYVNCGGIEAPDMLLHKIIRYKYPSVLWNKLFRRELAISSFENCVVGDDVSEDFLVNVSCLLQHPIIAYVPECLYYQNRDNDSSITAKLPTLGEALLVGKNNIERAYKMLKDAGVLDLYTPDFNRLVLNVKTLLLSEGRFREAYDFYPASHKDIITFDCIYRPANWIYYGALNWGTLGVCLFKMYIFAKRLCSIGRNKC